MRRNELEIFELEEIKEILANANCCHLAFADDIAPYVIAVNYGFDVKDNKIEIFFHSANEGKKINLINSNPSIGFEIDCDFSLVKSNVACSCSNTYRSIVGKGIITEVKATSEKIVALNAIMKHYFQPQNIRFDDRILENTAVFRIEVLELSAKKHM